MSNETEGQAIKRHFEAMSATVREFGGQPTRQPTPPQVDSSVAPSAAAEGATEEDAVAAVLADMQRSVGLRVHREAGESS